MVQKYSLPAGTKFIVVGGSYSGNLAAWARAKYPHLFDISLATSAPVLAVENFPEVCTLL
ncbi:Serine carboxypeptidase S28 [compost metagenome]